MDERLNVLDVAGASLALIGALVERYIKDGYCDPIMMNALKGATELAKHFQQDVVENFEHHRDQDLVDGVTELIVNLQVTIIEAGEVMNRVIEDNNLPVKQNTFEIDREHPNFLQHGEDCDCQKDGE